jgi:hypothetical protein
VDAQARAVQQHELGVHADRDAALAGEAVNAGGIGRDHPQGLFQPDAVLHHGVAHLRVQACDAADLQP